MAKAMEHASDNNANFLSSRRDSATSHDDDMMDEDEDLPETFKASIGLSGPEAVAETTEVDLDTEEALTAEFRFRLGMLDEDEDLPETFKASIGLSGPEAVAETTEVDLVMEKQYEATLKGFQYEKFARKNFKDNQSPSFSKEPIRGPLLAKRHDVDKLIAPLIWLCIQRYMGDIPYPAEKPPKSRVPMMTRMFQALEMYSRKRKGSSRKPGKSEEEIVSFKFGKAGNRGTVSEKRKSWRNLLSKSGSSKKSQSRVSSKSDELVYATDPDKALDAIPCEELELIHYIIGHGILRKELRDEIFCQLCKQLKDNPSKESALQGWVLMSLCVGCFLPSDQFINYLQSYLRAVRDDFKEYAMYTRRLITRATANGPRYHPPNWLEVQATKMRRFVVLPVALPDGRMQTVDADSAIIASEVCNKIAAEVGLKDNYGFSLFICIFNKVSSLGSGFDHVMDAIAECEQFMCAKGLPEEDAPWRLYFRKEIFVPWHNPEYCPVSTEFIYKQICKGIRTEEYRTRSEDELVRFVARRWYIEIGEDIIPGKLQAQLKEYIPKRLLSGGRSRDGWMNAIMASFSAQGFDRKCVPPQQVKWHIVVTAPYKWPLQFSGLFEVFRISGPQLTRNDLVIAISSRGVFLLDEPYRIIQAYKYYEIVEVACNRSHKQYGQVFTMATIKGDDFTFISPNGQVIRDLVMTFIDGLRQRSVCAVGLQEFVFQDASRGSTFQFSKGDVITLLEERPTHDDWVWGIVDESGAKGEFPVDTIYVLPAMEKPPPEFLAIFRRMSAADVGTLPRRRGAVKLNNSTGGSTEGQKVESNA